MSWVYTVRIDEGLDHMEQPTTAEIGITSAAFVIAGWAVDLTTLRLHRADQSVKLEPKAMAVLKYLALRPGQVVSRQELEEYVWAGTVVGYDAISNAIIKLRKAFGDDAHNPGVIETIPKIGYRLIAPVETNPECLPPESGAETATNVVHLSTAEAATAVASSPARWTATI